MINLFRTPFLVSLIILQSFVIVLYEEFCDHGYGGREGQDSASACWSVGFWSHLS